jgi:hypothetical protein
LLLLLLLLLMLLKTDQSQHTKIIMPVKAAAASGDQALTAKEIGLLRAMATLMDEAPKVSFQLVFPSASPQRYLIPTHLLFSPHPLTEVFFSFSASSHPELEFD